jgi:hypothetical protein
MKYETIGKTKTKISNDRVKTNKNVNN